MRIASLLLLVFLFGKAHAQSSYTKADSATVFSLIDKAENYFTDGVYDSALFYCDKAEAFSKQKNFKKGQAYALIEATDIYIDKDDLNKADATAQVVNKIGMQLKDSLITAITLLQMAQVKMYKNELDAAISGFDKSLLHYLAKHPTRWTALAYNDIGYTWGRKGEIAKQADYLIKSINIYENYFPDKYGELGVAYNNLSTVYYGLNDRVKAIEYAKKSLGYREKTGDISRLSLGCCNISQFYIGIDNAEAEKYLQRCIGYALQSNQESRIIHSYVTASNLYSTNGKKEQALGFELKAIELLEKNKKDPYMLARRYMAAGTLNQQLKKDSTTVLSYYGKSLALLQTTNDRANLRDYYVQLANYYSETKNYAAAFENYKKYILYRDSIVSDKTQTSITEITTRYETEKKDKEIIRLNTAQQIRQLEIEKQQAVIDGNAAVALQKQNEIDLLSKSQELQNARLLEQERELEKKELIATANQQQLQLAETEKQLQERTIKNQKTLRNLLLGGLVLLLLLGYAYFNRYQLKKKLEQQKSLLAMRNNISQDLHDDIGASLSNINILNELARRNISHPEKSKEYLSKASEDIQRISESLSDIVWNINPKHDDMKNLFVRMKRYAADMLDGKNINGHFDFPADENTVQLSMTQRRDLYLVFKEAVNNLVKYSGAKEASVLIQAEKHKIIMQVKDDGKGFDRQNINAGNGLYNMEQRAKASGGFLSIHSAPGAGTVVKMEMEVS